MKRQPTAQQREQLEAMVRKIRERRGVKEQPKTVRVGPCEFRVIAETPMGTFVDPKAAR